jgi:hypothetical protein
LDAREALPVDRPAPNRNGHRPTDSNNHSEQPLPSGQLHSDSSRKSVEVCPHDIRDIKRITTTSPHAQSSSNSTTVIDAQRNRCRVRQVPHQKRLTKHQDNRTSHLTTSVTSITAIGLLDSLYKDINYASISPPNKRRRSKQKVNRRRAPSFCLRKTRHSIKRQLEAISKP